MTRLIMTLGLLFTSIMSFCQQLEVSIIQGGEIISSTFDQYKLAKSPFTFQLNSEGMEGFLVGATLDKDVYLAALGIIDHEVSWFENTGMADEQFNPNQTLTLSNDVPSYWYFTSAQDHRFDPNAKGTAKSWTGNRTIDKIDILEADKLMSVTDLTQPIYVIFYQAEYDENYSLVDKEIVFKGEFTFL
ncbi:MULTISPECIES: hypothetical protein [Sphingobacterium]|jgi:hypothetical protein|uniref:hypothetical protein n=1 Tax=Sphingobacterium TaxID=28453 RepID=UPI0010440F81|nr:MULTISPECIES: hypothetical protein [Sphingobacterium]MCW2260309.1 hypothetical protein [Sphingobacterium kitahiroshimense]TCR05385.1 hypothetical protein EDF67_1106 [Sphingobacterium sp. JUb78]